MVNLLLKKEFFVILKIVLIIALLYLGFRYITKPFRDLAKQHRANAERFNKQKTQNAKAENKTKTENIGDYIDYEDIEE